MVVVVAGGAVVEPVAVSFALLVPVSMRIVVPATVLVPGAIDLESVRQHGLHWLFRHIQSLSQSSQERHGSPRQ